MQHSEKISRAKAKLLVDYPFFGTIASRLELVQNDDIQAFLNDGIKLQYNSDFINEASIEELEFVFANGAMHASLEYESRKNNRSGWLWQLSRDYAINDMLVQNGLHRPYQAHYSERFNGLYAEEIYADLKADIIRDADELPDNEGDDVNSESKSESSESPKDNRLEESSLSSNSDQDIQDQTLDQQLFEEFTHSTLAKEEKSSDLPASLERFFNFDFSSKYDWRDELRDAIDKFARDDYTQMPPNKKFLSSGIYLPSSTSETFNLVIAIDSSGSIDDKALSEFLDEINSLMLSIAKYKIDVLVCDYKIRLHKVFYSGEFLDIEVDGGGATDFRPVFEFIDKNLFNTKLLVYFSDLDGIYPKEMPSFEVKWVSPYSNTI